MDVIELFNGMPVISARLNGACATGVDTARAEVNRAPRRLAMPGRAFAS